MRCDVTSDVQTLRNSSMSLIRFIRNNPGYLPFFLLGLAASLPCNPQQIHGALEVVGVLMLVALLASLLVPFAAFSYPERGNKWILQNAPLAAFGAYAVEVIKEPSLIKAVLMLAAMGMHLSYWGSGIHSRAYRLVQFKLGFAADLPATCKLVAFFNATGRSDLADQLVMAVITNTRVTANWRTQLPQNSFDLVKEAEDELRNGTRIHAVS
ncbi:MAG: hypothetical protein AAB558_04495 [Patescibacteria group bacterium]